MTYLSRNQYTGRPSSGVVLKIKGVRSKFEIETSIIKYFENIGYTTFYSGDHRIHCRTYCKLIDRMHHGMQITYNVKLNTLN